ncbi:DivIVA domain-containing protein [Streptococcus oralis]|uniref:Uncharacterized protein n=1 Tax=Streptococcus oralis subsp. tigurinus TaxID=1077464 RepID=A0A1X1GEE5_STROR|nr:DivIVA domain-containing protein [Streptococcus oralis]ORO45251.1 hypothetical protein B7727_00015 [Streptococcus oralis subsp. tigurinus]
MRLRKTLFGRYRAKEVDDCIESLEEEFYSEIRKKNEKIESLRKKIDSMKDKEKEIGEAVIYAKSLVISAHKSAEQEAKEVLEKAQKDYLDIRESILEEIDILTKKRIEAERLYHLQKEKIKKLLNQVDGFLEDENLDKEINAATLFEDSLADEEQEELDLFAGEEEKSKDSVPQIEVVKIENITAKTGSESSAPVNYLISFENELTKEEQQEENTKHLSRVEDDTFL